MMAAVEELSKSIGVSKACRVLGIPRSRVYRQKKAEHKRPRQARPHPRALSTLEKAQVREVLNSERYADQAPRGVYVSLLDNGEYLCHWRTMYRILSEHNEVRERRKQLKHPSYKKPELLATGPNQVWSWDITRLRGAKKWTYYYLYVILDIYSRYVVGWMIASQESAALAEELVRQSCAKQGIPEGQLTLHADRGAPMVAKSMAMLLADLGINRSHSRPHVSDDNPYSEAQFKTMKYRPDYPQRFGSLSDARAWARPFFTWYNHHHYHSGIGLLHPADVHYGRAAEIIQARQRVLRLAYQNNPHRFVKGEPQAATLPESVWINPPKQPRSEGCQEQ